MLAAIATLRTAINYLLQRQINQEAEPLRREPPSRSQGTPQRIPPALLREAQFTSLWIINGGMLIQLTGALIVSYHPAYAFVLILRRQQCNQPRHHEQRYQIPQPALASRTAPSQQNWA